MNAPVISFCRTCEQAVADLPDMLGRALSEHGLVAELRRVDCMSGCDRGPALAVRQTGKVAYLFGEIGPADIPDLVRFLQLYAEFPDGVLDDARPIGGLRFKAIARIP